MASFDPSFCDADSGLKMTGKLNVCIGTIPGRIPRVPGVSFWPAVVNDGDRRLSVGELDSTDAPAELFVTAATGADTGGATAGFSEEVRSLATP